MQDSLLSRFDLLFIVLDVMEPESDRKISEHVLRMHKYRATGEQDGDPLPFGDTSDVLATYNAEEEEEGEEGTQVYAKQDAQLYGSRRDTKQRFVSIPFMKKYIHVAKNIRPALSKEAASIISSAYSELRDQESMNNTTGKARTMPVTARTLETMIRLATAHAKARMSKTIDELDAEAALEMVEFAYFHKVEQKNKRKRKAGEEGEDDEEAEEEDSSQSQKKKRNEDGEKKSTKSMRKPTVKPTDGYDPYDFDGEDDSAHPDTRRKHKKDKKQADTTDESMDTSESAKLSISDEKFQKFKSSLQGLFASEHAQTLLLQQIVDKVHKDHSDIRFSDAEVQAACDRMTDDNQIMVSEGLVYLV